MGQLSVTELVHNEFVVNYNYLSMYVNSKKLGDD